MTELPVINNYRELLRDGTPLIDVRAPVEFSKGTFPESDNLPLLNDEERHMIGIEYKEEGHDAAVEMGKLIINDDIKIARLDAWTSFVENNPNGALYCFRGGMRSKITQLWIYEATGISYPRVEGGYKQLRRYITEQLEETIPATINPVIIGGRTGVGKTRLLRQLPQHIDLEGLANHRGSAFGKHISPQPRQINFENRLAIELIRHIDSHARHLILEDESRNIGSLHLGEPLFERFSQAPLVMLEASLEERVDITFDEYVTCALGDFKIAYGDDAGFFVWKTYVQDAVSRIRKRLGGVRHKRLETLVNEAMDEHASHNHPEIHKRWIAELLTDYYDPMYDYQLSKKQQRICFSGNADSVTSYLQKNFLD